MDKFQKLLDGPNDVYLTFSRQSLASIASLYDSSMEQVFKIMSKLLPKYNVKEVLESSLSQKISLIEAYKEFLTRYD